MKADPEAAATVRSLQAEFSTADPARRIEIIYEIALQFSPDNIAVLRAIWQQNPDLELRAHIIRAQRSIFPAQPEEAVAFLRELLASSIDDELREAVADTLEDIDAPTVLPLWELLAKGSDDALRERAQAAIDFLRAREPKR